MQLKCRFNKFEKRSPGLFGHNRKNTRVILPMTVGNLYQVQVFYKTLAVSPQIKSVPHLLVFGDTEKWLEVSALDLPDTCETVEDLLAMVFSSPEI